MIDNITVIVTGGRGGDGAITFRRESYVPRGGPNGGDGGRGGHVLIIGDGNMLDLSHLRGYRGMGEPGQDGRSEERTGRNGREHVIPVPLGTCVWSEIDGREIWLGEMLAADARLQVAAGGSGGRGNARFATALNRVPLIAEEGEAGDDVVVKLQLRVPAAVAIIGRPGCGKSLLLNQLTGTSAEVADYPFTTREPILGVIKRGWDTRTVVELPGIIEGAHQGRGLGNAFLQHLWRIRLLIHLLDATVPHPLLAISEVSTELELYNPDFLMKPQILVVNEVDLPEVRRRIPALRRQLAKIGVEQHFVSAKTGEGLETLVSRLFELADQAPLSTPQPAAAAPFPRRPVSSPHPSVAKEGKVFVVSSSRAERLVRLPDMRRFQVRLQLRAELARLGVVKALEEAGVQAGDRVRIGTVEMVWE